MVQDSFSALFFCGQGLARSLGIIFCRFGGLYTGESKKSRPDRKKADKPMIFRDTFTRSSYLYDTIYDVGIGIGFDKYYPRDELKGSILANFSRNYIKEINKTFNNART